MDKNIYAKIAVWLRVPLLCLLISLQEKLLMHPLEAPGRTLWARLQAPLLPNTPFSHQAMYWLSSDQCQAPYWLRRETVDTFIVQNCRSCLELTLTQSRSSQRRLDGGVVQRRGRRNRACWLYMFIQRRGTKMRIKSSSLPLKLKVGFYQGFCVCQLFVYGRLLQRDVVLL